MGVERRAAHNAPMFECHRQPALALALLCSAGTGAAADAPLWELGLGAAALRLPQYRGADRDSSWLLPLPYVAYRGPVFKADRDGARATLVEQGEWQLNLSAALAPPLDSGANPARAGMPRLAAAAEIGPDLVRHLTGSGSQGLALHWPLRAAVTLQRNPQAIGWVSTPHLQWSGGLGDGWRVGLRGGAVYASRRYDQYYYGVTPAQATSTRAAYAARGDYGGLQALASLSRRWDRLWLGAYVQADSLRGSSLVDSPLVRRDHSLAVGVAMAWVFAASAQRVNAED